MSNQTDIVTLRLRDPETDAVWAVDAVIMVKKLHRMGPPAGDVDALYRAWGEASADGVIGWVTDKFLKRIQDVMIDYENRVRSLPIAHVETEEVYND